MTRPHQGRVALQMLGDLDHQFLDVPVVHSQTPLVSLIDELKRFITADQASSLIEAALGAGI
ncbi:hypothetical protein GCM10023074_59830 [Microbispora amethystogenes]|uniref:Uncharacterized protein n=1 Tax=Microbispora amethystogenes TaxID=1427754 RepID=A0ABQ4FN35_9ACTN|nr:hypothetical protein Mam01_63840 [Microbispora amethystogenes]